ncbi:MAG: ATP synthase F1 subunit delta [Candidatus Coatesbacteria bacterium]|nr:ATP synthase F1 subunit delta [Candidatus Coatesbacteria bacterium]
MNKALLASRYSKALSEVVPKEHLDETREELEALGRLVNELPEFYNALHNNTLELHVRQRLLDAVLGKLEPPKVLYSFLHLLLKHARISLLQDIVTSFGYDVDRRLGRLHGEIMSPIELPGTEIKKLQKRLSEFFGGEVVLTQKQDRSILGGFTVRIGDWLLDATLETELSGVKNRIGGLLEAGHVQHP